MRPTRTAYGVLAVVGVAVVAMSIVVFAGRRGGSSSGAARTGEGDASTPAGPIVRYRDFDREHQGEREGGMRIDGQVVDESGEAVAGAEVTITSQTLRQATTAADGFFYFDDLLPRDYRLLARKDARSSAPITVRASAPSVRVDPVVLRLVPASRLVVAVADDRGEPVVGAVVSVRGTAVSAEASTDALGDATVEALAPGPHHVAVSAAGFATTWKEVLVAPSWSRVEVRLARGAPVGGVVIDGQGRPVSRAVVGIELLSRAHRPRDTVVSDDAGRWAFGPLAAGSYRFWAWPEPGLPTALGEGSSAVVSHDGRTARQDVEIRLATGLSVSGTVAYDDGRPAAHARIRVASTAGGDRPATAVRVVFADERGAFTTGALPAGRLVLVADDGDRASDHLALELRADHTGVRLVLVPAAGIAGHVVDDEGAPVPSAQVVARSPAAAPIADVAMAVSTTDGAGHFRLGGLPPGEYTLRAAPPDASRLSLHEQPPTVARTGAEDVRVVVRRQGRIVGRIVRSDGSPARRFAVGLGPRTPQPFVAEDGSFVFEAARPGTHAVVVTGPDFARTTIAGVVVEPARTTDLGTVTVEAGRTISGLVVDEDRQGVAGASVTTAVRIEGNSKSIGSASAYRLGMATTTTDRSGHFTFEHHPSGDLVIVAEDAELRRSAVQVVGSGGAPITLVLAGAAQLAGVASIDGVPSAGTVQLESVGPSGLLLTTTGGADGSYLFERLGPGAYVLSATFGKAGIVDRISIAHTVPGSARIDLDLAGGPARLTVEAAEPGRFVQVLFRSPSAGLTGSLRAGAARAAMRGAGRMSTRIASAGSPAVFDRLPSATYSVCAVEMPGNPRDPAIASAVQAHGDDFATVCQDITVDRAVAISYTRQTFTSL